MNQAENTPVPDTVPVEDISQFAGLVAGWHNNRLSTLDQLLAVPEGATFEISQAGSTEPETIILTGDMLRGFQFGIEMARMQFKSLPFVAEFEDPAPAVNDATPG
jgi:hypothetical protein